MSKVVNLESAATVAYPDFTKVTRMGWRGHEQYVNSVRCLDRHPQRPEYAPKSISVVPTVSRCGGMDMAELTVVYRYVGPVDGSTSDEAIAAEEADRQKAEAEYCDVNSGAWFKDDGGGW